MSPDPTYTAFLDNAQIAAGPLETILPTLKTFFDRNPGDLVLIFDDHTCRQVDFDLRGPVAEVLARALAASQGPQVPTPPRPGPGRPKLGVVSREVSLLPRHWEWLEQQPNGASAALRRLVDEARTRNPAAQRARLATEAASRFLTAIAGNFPNYEEATRALYANDRSRLAELTRDWPQDIQTYLQTRLDAPLL